MAGILTTFIDRSTAGEQALTAALKRGLGEPERTVYLVAAETNVWASLFGWRRIKQVVKPMLLPSLAGRVLRSGAPVRERVAGLIGLAGGLAGDVVLLRSGRLPQGAAGFAVNHAAYCWLLWRRGARPSLGRVAVRVLPLAGAAGLAMWRRRELLPIVAGYGTLLAAVSTLADDRVLTHSGLTPTLGLGHGGNLFLVSDALLFTREVLTTADTWPARLADAGVMGTYTVAQLLLVDGLFSEYGHDAS